MVFVKLTPNKWVNPYHVITVERNEEGATLVSTIDGEVHDCDQPMLDALKLITRRPARKPNNDPLPPRSE